MSKFLHLNLEKRRQLEELLDDHVAIPTIANLLGVHNTTIYREVQRGMHEGRYSAEVAQRAYEAHLENKGRDPLIDSQLAQIISNMMLENKMTTGQVMKELKRMGVPNRPKSINTLYKAIDDGLIPGVTRETLKQLITHTFSNGHILLPSWVREKVKVADGTSVKITIDNNHIILEIDGEEQATKSEE